MEQVAALDKALALSDELAALTPALEVEGSARCHYNALVKGVAKVRNALRLLGPWPVRRSAWPDSVWACQVLECQSDKRATSTVCWAHYRRLKKYGDPTYAPPKRVRQPCAVDWCERLSENRGLCQMHAVRRDRGLALEPRDLRPVIQPCAVDWCTRTHVAKGLCNMHYMRQRSGLPLEDREIVSANGGRRPGPTKPCTWAGCAKSVRYALFCSAHYQMQQRQAKSS